MSPDIDIQAQQISAGLTRLQELLDNPVATSSLELSKNAAAADRYDILKRLRKSLLQYLERGGNLFYVGALGHFSAGKSSTINSLLDLWASQHERKTSLNPTDTTITLITRQKNAESLLGVIREGHVPIRLQEVEVPLLDQLVLVDTPGTGDPQFIEEVARDFLPICDVILFVFSAASPLDKSDVPLLVELHRRLAFIPLHFVVTRADELRLDRHSPLTEENLDKEKAAQFLDGLVLRINALLSPQVYFAKNFTFIDNKCQFRLNQLSNFLASRCDASSPQAYVSMHMNKLSFFLNGAKDLRDFFAGILDKKLEELSKIVQAAARNIERYQQIVQISNNNLTKNWIESESAIAQASSGMAEVLKPTAGLPAKFEYFQSVTNQRDDVLTSIAHDAKFNASSVSSGLGSQVNAALQDHFYGIQKTISETPLPELTASDHIVGSTSITAKLDSGSFLSASSLKKRWSDLRDGEASALRDAAADLRHSARDFEDAMNQRAPLVEVDRVVGLARESLTRDLNQFFQNVELYRSGVFSHTTKESIATLGIGQRLDDLEAEFTDADKALFTGDAVTDLFPGVEQLLANASTRIADVSPKVRTLAESARNVRIERPEEVRADFEDAYREARDGLEGEMGRQLQSEVDQFCGAVNLSLTKILIDAKSRYDSQIQNLKRARRKRYGLASAVTGGICFVGYLAYRFHARPAPTSTVGEAALSILCGLAVEVAVLLIVKWRENFPKLVAEAKDENKSLLAESIRQATELALREHQFAALNEAAIANRINRIYLNALFKNSDSWASRASETLDSIRNLQIQSAALRSEYLKFVEELRTEGSRYFTDAQRNLSLLNNVADRIKARAIEPSFALLDRTRQELSAVKTEVTAVQFD